MSEGTQTHFRSIVTDPYLRAVGSNGTIIAIGDGATVEQVGTGNKRLLACRKDCRGTAGPLHICTRCSKSATLK